VTWETDNALVNITGGTGQIYLLTQTELIEHTCFLAHGRCVVD
jgi:hypothetical protein